MINNSQEREAVFQRWNKKSVKILQYERDIRNKPVFLCPLLRIICDHFLITGLLNTSVSLSTSGASDSCCCPLPGCPLSARRWRVGGFLWCHTRSWHSSPGWQSDPGAWWQSEVELEEEKHGAWIQMWRCAADDCQKRRLWSLRHLFFSYFSYAILLLYGESNALKNIFFKSDKCKYYCDGFVDFKRIDPRLKNKTGEVWSLPFFL